MSESLRWQINMFTYLFYMDWDKSLWSHSWLPDDVELLSLLLSVPQNLSLVCLVCMWTHCDSDTGKPIMFDLHQLRTLRPPLKESLLQLFKRFFSALLSSLMLALLQQVPGRRLPGWKWWSHSFINRCGTSIGEERAGESGLPTDHPTTRATSSRSPNRSHHASGETVQTMVTEPPAFWLAGGSWNIILII